MIPIEMTHHAQWVCWRYELRDGKPTKVPYSPRTHQRASVTNQYDWGTYGEAVQAQQGYNGLGFVLTKNDPYAIIDLDDPGTDLGAIERAQKVLETFKDTYSEVSPSGKGLHIIVRANIEGGRRRDKIELYGTERYFTMTGQTYNDNPVIEYGFMLQKLWEELGGANVPSPGLMAGLEQRWNDEEIYLKASEHNEKFVALFNGRWSEYYASQSEADLALINIISFYSRNREQIERLFYYSALGKRAKAHRKDYVANMIDKSFDNLPPDIELNALMESLKSKLEIERAAKAAAPKPMLGDGWSLPPGLVGDIARFVYEAAPRPVQEIALAAAIGLMAGICGRAYNVSSTGLNQYILVLATTGRGKEAAKSGISKLMAKVAARMPGAGDFIGPGEIASGQALIKYLGQVPCFVSIVGEFGLLLEQMCSPHASASDRSLRRVILDLFSKSGKSDTLNPRIYSDKAQNTQVVESPSFTILGETTPDSFFPHLTPEIVAQGLLPRFTCIEYTGPRTRTNEFHATAVPNEELVSTLSTLCSNALTLAHNRMVIDVGCDREATTFIKKFDTECDSIINGAETDVARQLWSRAHLKLMKLAALIAVGCDIFQPVITLEIAEWAQHLVKKDIANILDRFETGRVGRDNNEQNQIAKVTAIIKDFLYRPYDQTLERYGVHEAMHRDRVIQWGYLSKRLVGQPAFKDDRMGAAFALKRTLETMANDGTIMEIPSHKASERYKYIGKSYIVVDASKLG